MKKLTTVSLVLILLITTCTMSHADESAARAVTGNNIAINLYRSGSTIISTASVVSENDYRITATLYIQKLSNGSWTVVTSSAGTTKVVAQCSASSGSSYKAYVVCTITQISTGTAQTVTKYSSILTY